MPFKFWKTKKEKESNEIFDAVLDALKFIKVELATHGKELELIKLRFKEKLFKKKIEEDPEEEKKPKNSDPFDEARQIRRDINDNRIGL